MKDRNGNELDIIFDPLQYIGRVHRGGDGRVKNRNQTATPKNPPVF